MASRRETTMAKAFMEMMPSLVQAAYHKVGNLSDAEEITQEIGIAILRLARMQDSKTDKSYTHYDDDLTPERVKAFIWGIHRYKVIDSFRRSFRLRTSIPLENISERFDSYIDRTVEDLDDQSKKVSDIWHSVESQLKPEDREFFKFWYFTDMSFKKIAAALGMEETAARQRFYRVRKQLRKRLIEKVGL